MNLPIFTDCFEAAALAASFDSRMVAGLSLSVSGPLESGRESRNLVVESHNLLALRAMVPLDQSVHV